MSEPIGDSLMLGPPSCNRRTLTQSAKFHAFVAAGVLFGIFVASLAMSLTLGLFFLCQQSRPVPETAANINYFRDRIQVMRIDAASDAAEMINFQSFRNWPDVLSIGNTVCQFHLCRLPELNPTISSFQQCSHPDPAAGFCDHLDFVHQSFKYGKLRDSHAVIPPRIASGQDGCSAPTLRPSALYSIKENRHG